jgi:hypothetical protein
MFFTGSIDSNLIGDFKNLKYKQYPFNDPCTVKVWKESGHIYEKYTGMMIDNSNNIPEWCLEISNNFEFLNPTSTLYCMTPGTILPIHRDTYLKYKKIFNLDFNFEQIYRSIVFLEDWDSGHYLEISNNPITKWKKGDYVMWKNDSPHIAANIGSTNRYTLQVTGVKYDF